MAKEIYDRVRRPSGLLLLFFCLAAPVGWKLLIGADTAVLHNDAGASGPAASMVASASLDTAVIAALKAPSGRPASLDPPASLPIQVGSGWRYFKGTVSSPPAAWNTVGFDDATWFQGPSGFGYGDGDDGTVLSDMLNSYVSVYIRREFTIANLSAIGGLKLTIDYDDGFVAYVNGVEVARSVSMGGTVGTPPAFNATAASHEAVAGGGGPAETFIIAPASLITGANVIAIEAHNQAAGSSDLTLIPILEVLNTPPAAPAVPSPSNGETGVSTSPELCVTVDDAERSPLDVTFYGREATSIAGDPFTIVALPDTQYYAASYPATFNAQTQWVRDNRIGRNIVFVTELGDCTDQGGIQAQWDNANTAFNIIENPVTTGLLDGIPYGVAVGNHDQSPNGAARSGADENVTTMLYNQTFGKPRFLGRGYFGDNYPLPGFAESMDNHYELFSASGMDFIIFHLEWDDTSCSWPSDGSAPAPPLTTCQGVLTWMRNILTSTYPNRRAIITTHWMGTPTSGGTGTPAFSTQGQAIFNAVKVLPNVFMTLGGHLDQADHRTDMATDGHPVHTLISDFQSRPNGGDGWLRIMTFDPQADTIHVETYSPTLGRFINKLSDGTPSNHADNLAPTENEITLTYDMHSGTPFAAIATDAGVPAGTQACVTWPGRQAATTYEWYAVANDGTSSTAGGRQAFTTTTECSVNSECDDADPCTVDGCNNSLCEHAAVANCCLTPADCDDRNVCTDDACTANECFHSDNSSSCSDGNVCTTADFCSAGSCTGGPPASCDDGNLCTTDSCATPAGCGHAYTPAPGCCTAAADCNDGNPSTVDACVSNSCQNTTITSCMTSADCDDNDVCTTEVCGGLANANAFALNLDGTNDCVKMGSAPGLNAAQFTLEAWFKRNTTPGTAVSTGTGGITAVPLLAKGAAESEAATLNMNYFFGLRDVGGGVWRLAADFEEGAGGTGPLGLNHPVTGLTEVTANVWHHGAATYDGATWKLYLDGNLDTTLAVNQPVASDSVQHFGIGTTSNSSGTTSGFFGGKIDEVRVWNVARTQSEILADKDREVNSGAGLIGHWGFSEGSGLTAGDSTTSPENGTLTNGPTWEGTDKPVFGSGTCSWTPVSCDDGDVCTVDTCNPTAGCGHAPGNDGVACDDGDSCTDVDICSGGLCAGLPNGSCCSVDSDCDDFNGCTADVCSQRNTAALSFNGTSERVEFGPASTHPQLGLSRFTIEFWFRRSGAGTQTGYWSGGTTAVPLVTKGRGVGDGGTIDLDYFVGIDQTGVVVADFEQVEPTAGADNRVAGTTTIANDVWYHAAATYDGTALKLYINGLQEGSLATTMTPRFDSVHRFAIGTAWNDDSNGGALGPAGFFQGQIDEVRVWDHARTPAEIQAGKDASIQAGPGLVAGWRMNEGSGTAVADSVGATTGTVSASQWVTANLPFVGTGTCAFTPTPGAACDDGNLCLTGDTCDANGACQPGTAPLDCNDANVCTDDSCDNELGCIHQNNQAPCNDGNACTLADSCDGGSCTGGAPPVCDDGNPCNGVETCAQATGCVGGTPLSCDDGNPCTQDSCGAGGCAHTPMAAGTSCADADVCNGTETCDGAGACTAGTPLTCNDGNACTSDSCSAATGCVYTNNTAPCDDGSACTQTDTCAAGVCVGSNPLVCDDGNGCTDDSCNPASGCTYANNTAPCTDGLACTGPDTCSGGICAGAPVPGCCAVDADCADASACTVDFCPIGTNTAAIRFDGVDDYVTMGPAPGLNATQFTIEGWFLWEGGGVSTTTGAGGTDIYPLVTKGAPQAEASNVDENYLLGIRSTGNPVLAADFEEGAAGVSPGLNHPIAGTAVITQNVWHHAAATYDGSCWKLYLDGVSDQLAGTACPGQPVRSDSIQHFGIATALTSTGARNGAFKGSLDEVRVWNRVLAPSEIMAGMTRELISGTGLIGRWGANEGAGLTMADSTSPAEAGTLTNGPAWVGTGLVDFGSASMCEHDPIAGCCVTSADCDDGNACNGAETCAGGSCQAGTAVVCGDDDKCTADTCEPSTGACVYDPIAGCCQSDAQCDDGNTCTTGSCDTLTDAAVALDGTNDYVTMGAAPALGTQTFTLEAWVKRTGTGATTSTGSGGITNLVPIVSKGRGEAETPANLNTNYVMGISGNVLAADFEDKATGLNHPVCGSTTIPTDSSWHHVAAAYDGTCWSLYVDGVAQTLSTSCSTCTGGACTVCPAAIPENTSIQHFGIGTAMTSTGVAAGFFMGSIDEVRVWSRALTLTEILVARNREVTTGTGLLGRWGLNETSGTVAANSVPGNPAGTLTNGAAFSTMNLPPVGTDVCQQTPVADGTSCSDGDSCTRADSCQSGVCAGTDPVVCTASDQCHSAGTCDRALGLCSNPPAPDGTGCDDGDSCSAGDSCTAGTCQAGPPRDDDGDTHAASSCGGDDCDDAQSSVWAAPGEVAEVQFADDTTLVWLPPVGMGGTTVVYDLIRSGDAADFVTSAVCVESGDGADTTAIDATIPPEGSVMFYLVRPENSCPSGWGVLGRDSSGTPKPGRVCP